MGTASGVFSLAGWGLPDEVFARLEGTWSLARVFSSGERMLGTAVFRAEPSRALLGYHEEGRMQLPDGRAFDGHRDYVYEREASGFTVHFAEQPRRLFHRIAIVPADGFFIGTASHLCEADTYDSRYIFRAGGHFELDHVVSGPRKDYVSRTVFTRQP